MSLPEIITSPHLIIDHPAIAVTLYNLAKQNYEICCDYNQSVQSLFGIIELKLVHYLSIYICARITASIGMLSRTSTRDKTFVVNTTYIRQVFHLNKHLQDKNICIKAATSLLCLSRRFRKFNKWLQIPTTRIEALQVIEANTIYYWWWYVYIIAQLINNNKLL